MVARLEVGLAVPECWLFRSMSAKRPHASSRKSPIGQLMLLKPLSIECSAS
jgi:hypothetical protein